MSSTRSRTPVNTATAMPRVFMVLPGEAEGSSMIFARRQIEALERQGMQCSRFQLRERRSLMGILREFARLRAELKAVRPDLVHAHFGTITGLLSVLAAPCPVIISFRGSDLNPVPSISRSRSWLGRLFSQLAALRARRILCVSEALRARLWWKRARVLVLPSAVDLDRFRPQPRGVARAELGWPDDELVVLFNAGQEPGVKRLDRAMASVELARLREPRLRLQLLQGEIEPDQIPRFMNAADCLLLCSDYEGSPNVVKEAMACNLPVVSVDVGDVAIRLRKVEPSCIAASEAAALADGMLDVLRTGRRSNGREQIAELGEDRITARCIELYRDAMGWV